MPQSSPGSPSVPWPLQLQLSCGTSSSGLLKVGGALSRVTLFRSQPQGRLLRGFPDIPRPLLSASPRLFDTIYHPLPLPTSFMDCLSHALE